MKNWYLALGIGTLALFIGVALLVSALYMPADTEPVVSVSDNCTMAYDYYHDVLLKYDYVVKQDKNGLINISANPCGNYDIGSNSWKSDYSGLHKTIK